MSAKWPIVPLGELTVNLDARRKPVKEPDRKAGPYPYYGASGIVDYVDGYLFDGEHLLIAEDGENLRTRQLPIAFMAKGKFWVNNHAHIVVGNERADTRYLMYAMQSTDVSGFLTGAVMPKLTQGNLNRIPLSCPPLDIQLDIVRILGDLDDKIELNRQINQTLEQIAQTIFKSWFVDFEPVKAKIEAKAAGRDPERAAMCAISGKLEPELDQLPPEQRQQLAATAALFPDELVESELGLIPLGWEVRTLGEVTSYLSRGISPKYTEDGGVLVLNQKCIRDNVVDLSKARRHVAAQRKIDGRELVVGDVLVNSTGVGTLGRVAQVLDLFETTIVDSHVTVVRAKSPLTWNYLGLDLLRRQAEIEALGEGSTGQTELNRGKLAGLMLTVPSANVLNMFDAITVPLRQKLAAQLQQSANLATLRDTLLPKLLSGELSVGISERQVGECA